VKVKGFVNRVNYHGLSAYFVRASTTVAEWRPYVVRASAICAFLLFTFYFASLPCPAQDDDYELAPPPLKFVAKDDKERLESEVDLKSRTKLALELMDERLAEGERLNSTRNFDGLFRQLGQFRGLVDYTFGFLEKANESDKKVLDNYKRFEISLRSFLSRVEVIHRELPFRYEEYVRGLMKYLRDARTKALDPQFSDTVLPGVKPSN